jgi:acyl dehydratase
MTQPEIRPGTEFRGAPRPMTRERMRWYVDAQPTIAADDGRIHTQDPTIHDDDEYARSQGLPGIIADGMVSTNWLMGLLIDIFGRDVARRSRLRTKYIAPTHENQVVVTCARVTSVTEDGHGSASIMLDVWCEDDTRKKLTVGDAVITRAAA